MAGSHRMFREDADGVDWAHMWSRQEARGAMSEPIFRMASARTLIDVGCGPGYFALCYQKLGADVLAVDLVPEALAFARARGVKRTLQCDAEAEPLPERGFDAATITQVLHHARDPLAILRHARAAARRVVIAEFDPAGPGQYGPPAEERISPARLAAWLRAAGFAPGKPVDLGFETYAIAAD